MNHTRTEIIVGVFVLVGIACLGYLAIRLGKLEVLGAAAILSMPILRPWPVSSSAIRWKSPESKSAEWKRCGWPTIERG